jgi:hypothetical protein
VTTAAAPAPAFPPRGEAGTKLRRPVLIGVALGVLGLIVLVALLVSGLRSPAKARPACSFGQPCEPPPGRVPAARGTLWKSDLGFQIEYPNGWNAAQKSGDALVLESKVGALLVAGRRGGDYKGLFDDKIGTLKGNLNLEESNDPARQILSPNVGYQQGMGKDYCGNATNSQGGVIPVDTVAMAASKDGVSAFVAFVSADCKKTNNSRKSPVAAHELGLADAVLNTFRWPSEAK